MRVSDAACMQVRAKGVTIQEADKAELTDDEHVTAAVRMPAQQPKHAQPKQAKRVPDRQDSDAEEEMLEDVPLEALPEPPGMGSAQASCRCACCTHHCCVSHSQGSSVNVGLSKILTVYPND